MESIKFHFSSKAVDVYFDASFSMLSSIVDKESAILVTDENVFQKQKEKFSDWKTIVIPAGEANKNQQTVEKIIEQLMEYKADRQSFLVGVGGGVVTDIAGYAASVYMRGIRFGFVPASILGMVDASVGGKSGIDFGIYKNLIGIIRHPEFLLFDYSLLDSLPDEEWVNGFAEIIKHACIADADLFEILQQRSLPDFRESKEAVGKLVKRNVQLKYNIVAGDELETGDRKLLNFGHTVGHAIENTAMLPHGSAISVGMMAACRISEKINNFSAGDSEKIRQLLSKYRLPVEFDFDKEKTWDVLLHDKKKAGKDMNFIVLDAIGKASVKKIPLTELRSLIFT